MCVCVFMLRVRFAVLLGVKSKICLDISINLPEHFAFAKERHQLSGHCRVDLLGVVMASKIYLYVYIHICI